MRHKYFGSKLSRTKNERRRLLQGLARDIIVRGSIKTTLAKAKAVQPLVEKLVTSAKKGDSAALRSLDQILAQKSLKKLLLSDVETRFGKRSSGFTRIVKLGQRRGDASEVVILQFVDERVKSSVIVPNKDSINISDKSDKNQSKKETKIIAKRGRPKKKV
ncbi:50S ribosomal protein L17 [Candidatus Gottesmanbacteria bacterium]|nr:50S ribosomal protein L17 [Candidatus Gottesmanbacteria bacterium]